MWVLIVTIIAMNITMNDIRNNHWIFPWILPRILPWMLPWMLPCILPWILPWIYKHSLPCVPFLHKKIGVVNCFVIGVIIEAVKRNPHPLFLFSHWIFSFTHVGAHPHPKTCCHIFYSLVLINLVLVLLFLQSVDVIFYFCEASDSPPYILIFTNCLDGIGMNILWVGKLSQYAELSMCGSNAEWDHSIAGWKHKLFKSSCIFLLQVFSMQWIPHPYHLLLNRNLSSTISNMAGVNHAVHDQPAPLNTSSRSFLNLI